MAKTSDQLRKLHPSRHYQTGIGLAAIIELLKRHFGAERPHVQSQDGSRLIAAIEMAQSEKARHGEGHASRKVSIKSLKAMLRLDDEELITALKNCDAATFVRIQAAHAELDYRRNGIPVFEVPNARLSNEDLNAAWNGDAAAYVRVSDALVAATDTANEAFRPMILRRAIELPTANQPLHLPMGLDGLKQAIADAITVAKEETGGMAGRKELPHEDDLARECEIFLLKYRPVENIHRGPKDALPSPAVAFTKGVFELAGMPLGESRIEELLTAARKPRKLQKLAPKMSN